MSLIMQSHLSHTEFLFLFARSISCPDLLVYVDVFEYVLCDSVTHLSYVQFDVGVVVDDVVTDQCSLKMEMPKI